MERLRKKIFVGVSGGVDSSVSAYLLKKAGHDVTGVFIRTWQPDFIECTWREERRDAMRVCAHLGIPFLECDAEEAYKNNVAQYMIEAYKKGRVPNPDVMCNREVKFGVFWNFAKTHGADAIATGHYAQVLNTKNENTLLAKGVDQKKDQSYFLWTLTKDDLRHTYFPIGHLKKSEVRTIAEKIGLPTALKKDSQGVCFLGELDMKDFLSHYISTKIGDVVNEQGQVIGHHPGAVYFTLGERHGFTITKNTSSNAPYYVVQKNLEKNTLTVAHDISTSVERNNAFTLESVNWISKIPVQNEKYSAQIRYHGTYEVCSIDCKDNTIRIVFENPQLISSGQSVVIYDKEVCIGGGVVA